MRGFERRQDLFTRMSFLNVLPLTLVTLWVCGDHTHHWNKNLLQLLLDLSEGGRVNRHFIPEILFTCILFLHYLLVMIYWAFVTLKEHHREKEVDGGIACWDLSLRKFNCFCLYRLGTLQISALLDDSLSFMLGFWHSKPKFGTLF